MSEQRLAAIAKAVILFAVLTVSTQQSVDPILCRRECLSAYIFFSRYNRDADFVQNFLTNCYSKCLPEQTTTTTTTTTTTAPIMNPSCGVQTLNRSRIVGGSDTEECEFFVIVRREKLVCSGSLLHRKYVITAAHCFKEFQTGAITRVDNLEVLFRSSGMQNLKSYNVSRLVLDQRYVSGINDYDVAVLTVDGDLAFSDCVSPLCLPSEGQEASDSEYCVATGWGATSQTSPSLIPNLQKVRVSIVDNAQCLQSYGSGYINELKICAGNMTHGAVDSCQGDSGGLLMCKLQNRWSAFGIGSFGSGCGRPGYPGVYTRISHPQILRFIKDNTEL